MCRDQIKAGNWLFNLGIRGDMYNGLTVGTAGGAAAWIGLQREEDQHSTACFLRAHAGDSFQTKTWLLSSEGCSNAVLSPLLACSSGVSSVEQPGFRNEFHAGLQQAFGSHVVFKRRLYLEVHA